MTNNYKQIPAELKQIPQWLGAGQGKQPKNPHTGKVGKSNDPETWGTYAEAIRGFRENPNWLGIGIVLNNTGIVCVDLDHCYNPDTGELTEEAAAIVKKIDSYTEISTSGTGLHIFCYGDVPDDGRKKGHFEIYKGGKYIITTGNVYGGHEKVEHREKEILALFQEHFPEPKPTENDTCKDGESVLTDEELIKKAENAKNGQLFRDLGNGNWMQYYPTQSEADLAYCNLLAFWTNCNIEQMDRLFRKTKLYRTKWDKRHGAQTYAEKTIQKAVAGCKEVYEPNRASVEVSEENESLIQYKGKRLTLNMLKSALEILGITVKYNQLLKETDITGLPEWLSQENATNTLPVYLMDCFRECDVKFASRQVIEDYLFCIADQNRYNPLEEYFYHGKWDGNDRLQELHRILSVTEPKYHRYIRKWLIQCVALALNDSETPVGSEGVLVLQGSQGLAKTSFFRILTPFPRWFVEGAVIDLKNKDSIINALSGWITELGELDATLQREQSSLKAFITNTEDRVRPPYGRTATRAPRRTSFCGTVNQDDYLRDTTGSRRFWTIPITNIDTATLFSLSRDWVNQLWYQVYDIYQQDHNGFRLTKAEMKALQDDNLEFSLSLQYETEIREMLDYDLSPDQWEWWKASEVAQRLPGNAEVRKVGKALKKIVGSGKLEVYCNAPFPTRTTRTLHGTVEYFIPLKHSSALGVLK